MIQSTDYADEETPWDVQLLITGTALGKESEARDLVAQVQGRIDEAKTTHPEFAGKTLVVDFGPESGGHWLLPENDPRRSLFTALGFATQDVDGDVSEEKLDMLNRDVLFVNGATKEQMLASPAFATSSIRARAATSTCMRTATPSRMRRGCRSTCWMPCAPCCGSLLPTRGRLTRLVCVRRASRPAPP